jgi:hypothetical protein
MLQLLQNSISNSSNNKPDEKIPGRNDLQGATDQTVQVNNEEARLRVCLEIIMEKPTKRILSYWK